MHYFPAFLDLRGRSCLVAGAGRVGRRKISGLLDAEPALLRIVDPALSPGIEADLEARSEVELYKRPFRSQDLEGMHLVIAGTSDARINADISGRCRERGILCNVVDQPELCSFILPAVLRREDLIIAVTTQGASPALARRIRTELEQRYGPEYAAWLKLLRRIRQQLLALGRPAEQNQEVFRSLTDEAVLSGIRAGDGPALRELLRRRLPRELHSHVEGFLHDLL